MLQSEASDYIKSKFDEWKMVFPNVINKDLYSPIRDFEVQLNIKENSVPIFTKAYFNAIGIEA